MAYTTIDDPSEYFQTKIYAGSNNNNVAFTFDGNSDMQPDWLWIKNRTEAQHHAIFDSSRGPTKRILASDTGAETTENTNLDSFDSDGFTLDEETIVLKEGDNFVAWGWKANGGTESGSFSESGNNPGVSFQANQTAGFSICTYTGTGGNGSFAHGLGVIPAMFMIKSRSGAGDSDGDWNVYHHKNTSAPATDFLILNENTATTDAANRFQDTDPTNASIYIGTTTRVNEDGDNYVCYAFAPIQGYSEFGGYVGNGDADGPFVYTGFKPAWVMIKETGATGSWHIFDNTRKVGNVSDSILYADITNAEATSQTGNPIDMLSNGFKCRGGGNDTNLDDGTYVYMAFAESPFVSSEGVPTTAR